LYHLSFHPEHDLFLLRFSGRLTIAEGRAAFLDIEGALPPAAPGV
jgi:hypothetical protein